MAAPAALRDYPSLQRRSNSVTVVTPGGDDNGYWSEQQIVHPSPDRTDYYRSDTELDGDTLLIGAPGSNDSAYQSGAVFVYQRSTSGEWVGTRTLLAGVEVKSFGSTIALDGHTAIANGSYQDSTRGLFYSLPDQATRP